MAGLSAIDVYIPTDLVCLLNNYPQWINFARPLYPAKNNNSVISQGDGAQTSNSVRESFRILNKETGEIIKITPKSPQPPKYQDVFGHTIIELAEKNKKIMGYGFRFERYRYIEWVGWMARAHRQRWFRSQSTGCDPGTPWPNASYSNGRDWPDQRSRPFCWRNTCPWTENAASTSTRRYHADHAGH